MSEVKLYHGRKQVIANGTQNNIPETGVTKTGYENDAN